MPTTNNTLWGNFAKAVVGAGFLSALAFTKGKTNENVATGINIAQQSGAIDALFSLFVKDQNPMPEVTNEIVANKQIIAAQQAKIDALTQQIASLSNTVNVLMHQLATNKTK